MGTPAPASQKYQKSYLRYMDPADFSRFPPEYLIKEAKTLEELQLIKNYLDSNFSGSKHWERAYDAKIVELERVPGSNALPHKFGQSAQISPEDKIARTSVRTAPPAVSMNQAVAGGKVPKTHGNIAAFSEGHANAYNQIVAPQLLVKGKEPVRLGATTAHLAKQAEKGMTTGGVGYEQYRTAKGLPKHTGTQYFASSRGIHISPKEFQTLQHPIPKLSLGGETKALPPIAQPGIRTKISAMTAKVKAHRYYGFGKSSATALGTAALSSSLLPGSFAQSHRPV